MSRSQQDTVIDDDEETCPLCIEEFDLSDKNFRPCPCGYQICQFCFNSLKTTYEKSTCPNCRRVYDEKTIQYKIPTAEEFKLDQQNKLKKQAASKRKESEKREVETSNRRNLAGVRVKQQNLVYVIGLVPSIKDENVLLQTLRGDDYFGQYGEIEKIVVSKAKPGAVNQGVGVYVTYATKEAAASCITTVDGTINGDRVLRAQFGTTKYCSAYLRGEVCNNKNCSFLHETGEDGQTTTIQNEPIQTKPAPKPSYASQTPQYQSASRQTNPAPPSTASSSTSQPMARQSSKDEPNSRKGSTDTSALPSSVSWANANAPVIRTRRASQAASRSSPSPQVAHATVANPHQEEHKPDVTPSSLNNTPPPVGSTPPLSPPTESVPRIQTSVQKTKKEPRRRRDSLLDGLIASVNSPEFRFVFDDSLFSIEELAALERQSVLIDPFGGAKLRAKREREAAERAKQEAEAEVKAEAPLQIQASANEEAVEDGPYESGSLALGGEPEDDPRSVAVRSAIQRPSQPTSINHFLNDQFSGLNGRNLVPHQRQQMSQVTSSNIQQAPGLGHPTAQPFNAGTFDFEQRSGSSQAQPQHESPHGHGRQHSRFNFSNDLAKHSTTRYPTQQPSAGSQHFYTSGVQGPPPGLKTAGTPPISGGGMFAQGHGFASNMSAGFGTVKDANTDMLMRGRSGTNTGHDIPKREYLLSLQNTNRRSSPPSAPASGLLNPLYGQYAGAYQDPGLVKQKKKGKKHRHANTSSSGGGVVDLADPSILQARLHSSGAGAGQGLFGGQNQDDIDFPPLAPVSVPLVLQTSNAHRTHVHSVRSSQDSSARSTTPKVPPGLSLPHAHPPSAQSQDAPNSSTQARSSSATLGPVAPAVPVLSTNQLGSTPKEKPKIKPNIEMDTIKVEESVNERSNELKRIVAKSPNAESFITSVPNNANAIKNPLNVDTIETAVDKIAETKTMDKVSVAGGDVHDVKFPATSSSGKVESTGATESKLPSVGHYPGADHHPVLTSSITATPTALSRPATPVTGTSRTSEWSAVRPKTLRITPSMSQKPDTTPVSATAEKIMALSSAPGKQRSRQPSVSSLSRSRPSTPAVSDNPYSNDVSRASSPRPNIIGSAPEKSKSRNLARKEKKSKAKEATETSSDGPPTPIERKFEEAQPIVARQTKKKKKTQDRSIGDDDATSAVATEMVGPLMPAVPEPMRVTKQQGDKPLTGAGKTEQMDANDLALEIESGKPPAVPTTRKEEKVASSVTRKEPYTLNQLLTGAGKLKDPAAFKTLLDEHVSNIQTLFSQLLEAKELDQSSALFNLPPFSSYRLPPDSRRGADYLDGNGYTMSSPFGEVYLNSKQKRELQQGIPVRISDPNRPNDLLKRTLITKSGRVYRHLSQEEEERALQLEERREENEKIHGELGTKPLSRVDEADFLNIQGGLDELLKHSNRHGISWVMDENEDLDGDMDEEDDTNYDMGEHGPGDLASLAGGWQPTKPRETGPPAVGAKDHGATRQPAQKQSVNLRAMDIDKLQRTIKETQLEMEQARKEMEGVEKKWAKKGKEAAKWRESILKGKPMVGSD